LLLDLHAKRGWWRWIAHKSGNFLRCRAAQRDATLPAVAFAAAALRAD